MCVSDPNSDSMRNDDVSNVTVSPGESLLLRCRIQEYGRPSLVWENGNKTMDPTTFACPSKIKGEVQLFPPTPLRFSFDFHVNKFEFSLFMDVLKLTL